MHRSRTRLRLSVVLAIGLALWLATDLCAQSSISLDRVNGLATPETLRQGQMISFALRLTNSTGQVAVAVSNGFRVYSPDGAEWTTTSLDTTAQLGRKLFPMGLYLRAFSEDGAQADTVGFLGVGENIGLPSGLPIGYDKVGLEVQIGPIPESSRGKTICIDSSFYFNGGVWKWALTDETPSYPSWDGPHCYQVECCQLMGDVDDNGSGPDISDLVYLVQYMFMGGNDPYCLGATDVDGSGEYLPDISDIVYLTTYMFAGGPPPLQCP